MKWYFLFLFVLFGSRSFSQEKDLSYFLGKAHANSPLLTDYQNQINSATLNSLLNKAVCEVQVIDNQQS